jgi:hypothetical protein
VLNEEKGLTLYNNTKGIGIGYGKRSDFTHLS